MKLVFDIETDGLIDDVSKIWCIVCKDIASGATYKLTDGQTGILRGSPTAKRFEALLMGSTELIGHNIIEYDLPVIERFLGIKVRDSIVTDTLVLSRLLNYKIDGGHSLDAWGQRLKFKKQHFDQWEEYSEQMLEYCANDVEVNAKLYHYLMDQWFSKPEWSLPKNIEHRTAFACRNLQCNGFKFDYDKAMELYEHVDGKCNELLVVLQEAFPPKRVITELKTKSKIDYVPFNPGSPKQVVERLNEAGWKPTVKTDGHIDALKKKGITKEKLDQFKQYGWKVNEENLATVPASAPDAVKKLLEFLIYKTRRSKLEEWFRAFDPLTGCIHGRFNHIGTWTHRMSHQKPNMGNVSAEKSLKYNEAHTAEIVKDLGKRMRALWTTDEDEWLVGTDAKGIQFRVLAHYVNDDKLTEAVLDGDIHTLNWEALGPICKTRDDAKTFTYAWLLGAGVGKVSEILDCTIAQAKAAVSSFIEYFPGLKKLKQEDIPNDMIRGYCEAFDGRKVMCDSAHLMITAYLQLGEAIIMKYAMSIWMDTLDAWGVRYKLVNFIHDEWQTVAYSPSDAMLISIAQTAAIAKAGRDFKLNCPMDGDSRIGKNWYETH